MKWMIFARELDGQIYIWNGDYPVCITPFNKEPWDTQATGSTAPVVTVQERATLDATMSSKKRTFVIDKKRYIAIARGETPDLCNN